MTSNQSWRRFIRPWMLVAVISLVLGLLLSEPVIGTLLTVTVAPMLIWPATIHAAMLMLAWDCRRKKTPTFLIIAPIAFYVVGIGLCIESVLALRNVEQEIAALNRAPISFDPTRESLVIEPGELDLIGPNLHTAFDIDVIYYHDDQRDAPSGGYHAVWAMPQSVCRDRLRLPDEWIGGLGVGNGGGTICTLSLPESPVGDQLRLTASTTETDRGATRIFYYKADITSPTRQATAMSATVVVLPPILLPLRSCWIECKSWLMGFPVRVSAPNNAADQNAMLAEQIGRTLQLRHRPAPSRRFGAHEIALTAAHEAALARAREYQEADGT